MAHALTESRLREWMQRLGPRLIALSSGICHDQHRAEEIVQEAFVKLWKAPPDAGEVAFSSWLRRVVTNLSINALQRTKRPGTLPEISTDPAMRDDEQPEEALSRAEELALVRAAIERLDEPKRAILVLRAFEGLSYEEIAESLGVPVGTVMSRLNRARAALADAIKQEQQAMRKQPSSYDIRKYREA